MTEFFRALRRLNPDLSPDMAAPGVEREGVTPFYSRLEQTLLDSPMNQGTAQAWADLLNARRLQGGVANNEVVLSGIQSRLDSLRGSADKLTKQDLLDQYYKSPIGNITEQRYTDMQYPDGARPTGRDSSSYGTMQGNSSRWTLDPADMANAGWEFTGPASRSPSIQSNYRETALNMPFGGSEAVQPYLNVTARDISRANRGEGLTELDMPSSWSRSHINEPLAYSELGHQRSFIMADPNAPGGPQKIYVNTETQSDNLQYVQSMNRGTEDPVVLEDVQKVRKGLNQPFESPLAKSGVYEGMAIRRNIMDALDNDADAIAIPNGRFVAARNGHQPGSTAFDGTIKYQDDKFVNEMLKQLRKAGFKADRNDIRFVSVDRAPQRWFVPKEDAPEAMALPVTEGARYAVGKYPDVLEQIVSFVGDSQLSPQSKTVLLTGIQEVPLVRQRMGALLAATDLLPPEVREPYKRLVAADTVEKAKIFRSAAIPDGDKIETGLPAWHAKDGLEQAISKIYEDNEMSQEELTALFKPFLNGLYRTGIDTTSPRSPREITAAITGVVHQTGDVGEALYDKALAEAANYPDFFRLATEDLPRSNDPKTNRGYYVFDLKDDAARSTIKEKGLPLLSIPAGVLSILGLDEDDAAPQPEQRKNGGRVGYAAGGLLGQYEPERREAEDVSFIGRHAQNIDLDKLLEGVRRLDKKEDPKKVWEDLGVFLPPGDVEPRMELPLLPEMLKKRIGEDELLWLPELLDHPDLYKAYPGLQKTVVYGKTAPGTLGGTQFKGYTDPTTGKQSTVLRIDPAQPDLEMLDTLGHETQHIIQGIYEDWPGGGTSSLFEGRSKPSRLATLQREKAINDGIYRMEALSGGRVVLKASPYSGVQAELVMPGGKRIPVSPSELGASSSVELEKFVRQGSTPFATGSGALRPDTPAYRRAEWDLERERAIRDKDQKNLSPLMMYRLLTGEIEAFDVGSRLQKRAKGEDVGTPALLDWRKSMRYDRRNPEPRKKPTEFSSGGLTSLRKSIDSL